MNLYVESVESGSGKARATLVPTPGLKVFATPTAETSVGIAAIEVSRLGNTTAQIKTVQVVGGTLGAATLAASKPNSVAQSGGLKSWINPEKVEALDDLPAVVSLAAGEKSNYLDVTGFGFSIPPGSTIQGITAQVLRGSSMSGVKDETIQLLKAGSVAGDNKATSSAWTSGGSHSSTASVVKAVPDGMLEVEEELPGGEIVTRLMYTQMFIRVASSSAFSLGQVGSLAGNSSVYMNQGGLTVISIPSPELIVVALENPLPPEAYEGTGGTFTVTATGGGTAFETATYGGASDNWTAELTAEDISASGFGLRVQCHNEGAGADEGCIDYVSVTVHYTPRLPNKLIVETQSAHGLTAGQKVVLADISGLQALNGWEAAISEVSDATHFSITSTSHPWEALYGPTANSGTVTNLIDPYAKVTLKGASPFSVGTDVTLSGLTAATWLNGISQSITGSPASNQLTFSTTHEDYPNTPDAGTVSLGKVTDYPRARASHSLNTRCFVIVGTNLFEMFADGSYTPRGTVDDDGKPASIDSSAIEMCIASAGKLYCYNLSTNVLEAVSDSEGLITNIRQVAYCDGYFVALVKDSQKFRISGLLNGTSWDPADAAIVSVFPDNVTSMIVDHRELWLFGGTKSVVYANTGNTDFPFEVIPGSYIDQGSAATMATVRLDNSVLWIGQDDRGNGIAWRAQGYTPQRISNHAVEAEWQKYKTIADAVGYGYQDNGHSFWVLYFPTASATWVYDVATGLWHERGFWDGEKYQAHRSMSHVFAFGKHLVCDWNSGNIYEMSSAIADDFSHEIRRLRRAPYIAEEGRWLFFNRLEIEGDYGNAVRPPLLDDDGNERGPQIMIRWSDDGCKTWSNEQWLSAGKVGEYKLRAILRRMGRCWGTRGRVYEMVLTDPVDWRITDAYIEVA